MNHADSCTGSVFWKLITRKISKHALSVNMKLIDNVQFVLQGLLQQLMHMMEQSPSPI